MLFHLGDQHGKTSPNTLSTLLHQERLCVRLSAHLYGANRNELVSSHCSPSGTEGTCLGEVTLPSSWWPSLTGMVSDEGGKAKQPKLSVKVTYTVFEAQMRGCAGVKQGNNNCLIQCEKIVLQRTRKV